LSSNTGSVPDPKILLLNYRNDFTVLHCVPEKKHNHVFSISTWKMFRFKQNFHGIFIFMMN